LKLEFFEDGMDGGPLILLYSGTLEEVALLRGALQGPGEAVGNRLAIHSLPFVHPVAKCSLDIISTESHIGVVATPVPGAFEWLLRPESWLHIEYLLEPFCEQRTATTSFQYLNPADGPEVIYSTDRAW
jgi:hypothetical protein